MLGAAEEEAHQMMNNCSRRKLNLDIPPLLERSVRLTDLSYIAPPYEYLAIDKMQKMQFNGHFSWLSPTWMDSAKSRHFRPG